MNAQSELFENIDPPTPAPAHKLFRGANGVELPYWEEDGGKIVRVALSDKLILPVTHQKGGHIYANDPGGWGRIERKNKISFLSAAAQIRRAIEINNSVQDSLKEQDKLLHAALEWSRKSLYGQLRRWFGVKDRTPDCTLVVSNTAVGEQIGLGREAVGDGLRELELLRLIHVEGPPKGVRYVFFHVHPWMQNPDAVPTWVNLPQVGEPACANSGRPLAATSPITCGDSSHKETSKDDDQNKKRVLAPNGERELLAQIREILGATEMQKHGGMWRERIRHGAAYRLALSNTIEDYNVRTPEQRAAIRNRSAWFTDRFMRNLVRITGANPK